MDQRSMIKAAMKPHPDEMTDERSGIAQVVLHMARYMPDFGIEIVNPKTTSFDVRIGHAAAWPGAEVNISHGLLWTAEFELGGSSWETNRLLVDSLRRAREVTVPSEWVAMPMRRDMHLRPHVIDWGVDFDEWQHDYKPASYVLWTKNRTSDGLDPSAIDELAQRFPKLTFVTTFGNANMPNVKVLGQAIPHDEMKHLIQRAAVVFMSDRETWGIAAAEAMAAGTPVLTVNSGAVPTFVEHMESGYCYMPRMVDDAAIGLQYCLDNRKRLSENAKDIARGLTWERACEKLADVVRAAMVVKEPTVGAVIPCHNYGHHLERAVTSVLDQTYEVSKVVIVDDDSDDDTETVGRLLCERDQRVVYLRANFHNVALARNAGIDLLDTKYVIPLDADDYIEPKFTQRIVTTMEADPSVGFGYTGAYVIVEEEGKPNVLPRDVPEMALRDGERRDDRQWPTENWNAQILEGNQIPSCSVIRMDALERAGGYRARYAPDGAGTEDANLYLRLMGLGWFGSYIPPIRGSLWVHRHGKGHVSGQEGYQEVDWRAWSPWTRDYVFPLAAIFTPKQHAHPIRSYEKPLVSVIIPVGEGHEEAVIEAIDSLEAQSFRDWEAIVVWDSPNEEPAYRLRRTFPFARFYRTGLTKSGYGPGLARNVGAHVAKSQIIAFLDADDYYAPFYLEQAFRALRKEGKIVYTNFYAKMRPEQYDTYGGDIITARGGHLYTKFKVRPFDKKRAMQRPEGDSLYSWAGINILTLKLWHDQIGGFDEEMESWEDLDYLLRLVWSGREFHFIDEPLWTYNFASGKRREISATMREQLVNRVSNKYGM